MITSFIIRDRTWQAIPENGEAVVVVEPLYEWRVTRPPLPSSSLRVIRRFGHWRRVHTRDNVTM
jgi:hypothetical protein